MLAEQADQERLHRDVRPLRAGPLGLLLVPRAEHLDDELVLAGEVVQQPGVGDAGAGGDVAQRGAVDPALDEAVARRPDDRLPAGCGLRVRAARAGVGHGPPLLGVDVSTTSFVPVGDERGLCHLRSPRKLTTW